MRPALLCLAALALIACRDSPMEVVEEASESAAQGDLVGVQSRFSVFTVQRLERHWRQNNLPNAEGWSTLASRLTLDGAPVEVVNETIHGEYAVVETKAGTSRRDYFLRKVDGAWRIELGAGPRYRRLAAAADAQGGDAEKDEE